MTMPDMRDNANHNQNTDIVLLGGGHAHVLALRKLCMTSPSEVFGSNWRVTLVSEADHSPYSGMLPGLVAGHYQHDDVHIDLRRLCAALEVRFIRATCTGIDPATRTLALEGRPDLEFDYLSVNIGAQPALDAVPGAAVHAIPVKPVASFYPRWQKLLHELETAAPNTTPHHKLKGAAPESAPRLWVAGGGAGGVEITLAAAFRLAGRGVAIGLLCGGGLLPGYNRRARARVRASLQSFGVEVIENDPVTTVEANRLTTAAGRSLPHTGLLWCTAAAAPAWLGDTGLPLDGRGFLLTDDTLQVQHHPHIFAVGDAAVQVRHPRPRAGVHAVRQGPVLAQNLARLARGVPLLRHRPQRRFLSLLSLGPRRAVAERGLFSASGAWVWRWKNHIDRRFMARFTNLPPMGAKGGWWNRLTISTESPPMHCGGCGAKLPATMLRDTLGELARRFPAAVNLQNFDDDAAQLAMRPGELMLQTADTLRDFLNDPWLMGRVAALHALSDLHAMGAEPGSCLAHVCLPHGGAVLQSRDLTQLMCGAVLEMARANCALVGGHSIEGAELSIGFTVNGQARPGQLLTKGGARDGCALVLTKPLGTGVIFAAHGQGQAGGGVVAAAIDSMLRGNGAAARIARESDAMACTDVTGFGLAGHLLEMLAHNPQLQARLRLPQLPLLEGVEDLLRQGFASTLAPGNRAAAAPAMQVDDGCEPARVQALHDPQTSGGLLIAVVAAAAPALLAALRGEGYQHASVIGEFRQRGPGEPALRVAG